MKYRTDDGPQGWVPLLILRPAASSKTNLPTVVLLHPTGGHAASSLY